MMLDERSAVVVTGGSSGLGAATARRLAASGAQVVVADLASPPPEIMAAGDVAFIECDVRDPAQVAAAMASPSRPLRAVVHCAGVPGQGEPVLADPTASLDLFNRIIDINLRGTFHVLLAAGEAMSSVEPLDEERGVIVLTSSIAAFEGQWGQTAYASSKGGVSAMVLPMARELANAMIRVVAIAPGLFETPILGPKSPEALASLSDAVPHPHRMGRPDEYALLAEHIINNAMLNGEVIRLDAAVRQPVR